MKVNRFVIADTKTIKIFRALSNIVTNCYVMLSLSKYLWYNSQNLFKLSSDYVIFTLIKNHKCVNHPRKCFTVYWPRANTVKQAWHYSPEIYVTREEKKMLGYFKRLDETDQQIIIEILQKSLRLNRTIWSGYCFGLLRRLDELEKIETATIDLFR